MMKVKDLRQLLEDESIDDELEVLIVGDECSIGCINDAESVKNAFKVFSNDKSINTFYITREE